MIKKNKEAKAEENADPNVQEAPKSDKTAPKKTKPKAAKIKDAGELATWNSDLTCLLL